MAKGSGGTRNYSGSPATLARRREEFDTLMNSGEYDHARSLFDATGGFVATHKGHNDIKDSNADKSDVAAELLAKKGYKVYLDNEKSTIKYMKMPDGRVYDIKMDIKTVNEAGANTVKSQIEKASKQLLSYPWQKHAVVLYQNNTSADKNYMVDQIERFYTESPKKLVRNIDVVIVVGANGHVHRHYKNKKE